MGKLVNMRDKSSAIEGLNQLIEYVGLQDADLAEVGCYQGQSTELFAKSGRFSRIYAIDPWENGYDDTDIASHQAPMSEVERAFDKRMKKYSEILIKYKQFSFDARSNFKPGSLDMVYIDGDHRKEAVIADIENYLPLIKPGGYLSGHDWLTPEVQSAIKEVMKRDPDRTFPDRSWVYKL